MMRIVNLARHPFVNTRPVRRMSMLLWVIGGLLLVANIWLYLDFWKSSAEIRGQLTQLDDKIQAEKETLEGLDRRLAALDLKDQNVQVLYLNRLISYRTFPWSSLFDQLVDVLPSDVRLVTVRPEVRLGEDERLAAFVRSTRENSSRRSSERRQRALQQAIEELSFNDEVVLGLSGVAKGDDALFAFVDALYEAPAFRQAVLNSESRDPNSQMISFSLQTVYRIASVSEDEEALDDGDLLADEDLGTEDLGDEEFGEDELDGALSDEEMELAEAQAREARLLDEEDDLDVRSGFDEESEADSRLEEQANNRSERSSSAGIMNRRGDESRRADESAKSRRTVPSTARPDSTVRRNSTVRPSGTVHPNSRPMIPQSSDEPEVQPRRVIPRDVPPRSRVRPEPPRSSTPPSGLRTPTPIRPSASAAPRLRGSLELWPWHRGPKAIDSESREALS